MSAPLRLDAVDLQNLGTALDQMTKTTRDTGVCLAAYGSLDVAIGSNTVRVSWDEDQGEYVIDDQNGG